jgi:hypothetical protein
MRVCMRNGGMGICRRDGGTASDIRVLRMNSGLWVGAYDLSQCFQANCHQPGIETKGILPLKKPVRALLLLRP